MDREIFPPCLPAAELQDSWALPRANGNALFATWTTKACKDGTSTYEIAFFSPENKSSSVSIHGTGVDARSSLNPLPLPPSWQPRLHHFPRLCRFECSSESTILHCGFAILTVPDDGLGRSNASSASPDDSTFSLRNSRR